MQGRERRQAGPERTSCSLYILTDPVLWSHVMDRERDIAKTNMQIMSIVKQHVQAGKHFR